MVVLHYSDKERKKAFWFRDGGRIYIYRKEMYMGEVKELYRGRNTWERKNKESGSRQDSHWQRTAFSDVEVEVLWLQLVESRRAIPAATHTHTHTHTLS
jgi:hypothetical protein